jgi:hypothetical protein
MDSSSTHQGELVDVSSLASYLLDWPDQAQVISGYDIQRTDNLVQVLFKKYHMSLIGIFVIVQSNLSLTLTAASHYCLYILGHARYKNFVYGQ